MLFTNWLRNPSLGPAPGPGGTKPPRYICVPSGDPVPASAGTCWKTGRS